MTIHLPASVSLSYHHLAIFYVFLHTTFGLVVHRRWLSAVKELQSSKKSPDGSQYVASDEHLGEKLGIFTFRMALGLELFILQCVTLPIRYVATGEWTLHRIKPTAVLTKIRSNW